MPPRKKNTTKVVRPKTTTRRRKAIPTLKKLDWVKTVDEDANLTYEADLENCTALFQVMIYHERTPYYRVVVRPKFGFVQDPALTQGLFTSRIEASQYLLKKINGITASQTLKDTFTQYSNELKRYMGTDKEEETEANDETTNN